MYPSRVVIGVSPYAPQWVVDAGYTYMYSRP